MASRSTRERWTSLWRLPRTRDSSPSGRDSRPITSGEKLIQHHHNLLLHSKWYIRVEIGFRKCGFPQLRSRRTDICYKCYHWLAISFLSSTYVLNTCLSIISGSAPTRYWRSYSSSRWTSSIKFSCWDKRMRKAVVCECSPMVLNLLY